MEAARQETRAADAERSALELKSQLYASIGIMAGSYAHNIKNLLVRPNDLIARCLEADGLSPKEKEELYAFAKAGTLLGILKSKARRTLKIKPKKRILS